MQNNRVSTNSFRGTLFVLKNLSHSKAPTGVRKVPCFSQILNLNTQSSKQEEHCQKVSSFLLLAATSTVWTPSPQELSIRKYFSFKSPSSCCSSFRKSHEPTIKLQWFSCGPAPCTGLQPQHLQLLQRHVPYHRKRTRQCSQLLRQLCSYRAADRKLAGSRGTAACYTTRLLQGANLVTVSSKQPKCSLASQKPGDAPALLDTLFSLHAELPAFPVSHVAASPFQILFLPSPIRHFWFPQYLLAADLYSSHFDPHRCRSLQ